MSETLVGFAIHLLTILRKRRKDKWNLRITMSYGFQRPRNECSADRSVEEREDSQGLDQ